LSAEKVSKTACKAFGKKKQKRVLKIARLNAEKGSPDYSHATEKAKSKRRNEIYLILNQSALLFIMQSLLR
jgi:hypothetical protein